MEFSSKSLVDRIGGKDPTPSLTIDRKEMKRLVQGDERHITVEVRVISIEKEGMGSQAPTSMDTTASIVEDIDSHMPKAKRPKLEPGEPQPGPSGLNHPHLKISDAFTLKTEPTEPNQNENSDVQIIEGPEIDPSAAQLVAKRPKKNKKKSRYDSSSDELDEKDQQQQLNDFLDHYDSNIPEPSSEEDWPDNP